MSVKQSYKVLKPVNLDGIGTAQPGDSVTIHPRQAVFLLTNGTLEKAEKTTQKTTRKESEK